MTDVSVSQRDELIFLLNQATELEHSLSCSYLFTAFSLKSGPDEGLSPEHLALVRGWKQSIVNVAVEEMFHLAIVNNLLTALGAAPNFDRPNFPHDCAYYMPDFQIELRPFNEEVMRHFIAIEQPDGSNLPALTAPERLQHIEGSMENEIGADPMQFDSQGDVYTVVQLSLTRLAERLGEEHVFIGPAPTPALRNFFESNGWEPITDLGSTFRNLARVVEQGEGSSGDNPDSHHKKFEAILEDYLRLSAQDADFAPARAVLQNPFARTPPEASGPVNLIDDPDSIRVSDLFNEAYVAMLQLLGRFFMTTEETEAEATALIDAAIEVMGRGLVPLGELLAQLPAGPGHPGQTAGPSFVVRTVHPLPHKEPAWAMLRERFQELSTYTDQLAGRSEKLASLQEVGRMFAHVVEMLA